jgi:RHS repeat-associated protein
MWSWFSDPFGTNLPNENPASLGAFSYNLRFPGQMFDAAAGLHQNYFRDYDPATGAYVESDPIGLKGGINTYGYANQSPTTFFDADGRMIIGFRDLLCGFLAIQVQIVCKDALRRCNADDSCDDLQRKSKLHLTCALAQISLTTRCFPNDPTHQQRISDAVKGARRCAEIYQRTCMQCPAPE